MILMGDEVRRTQNGNNNAYCHDDETNWFDWRLIDSHRDVHRFVSMLAARRLLRNVDAERQRVSLNQLLLEANIAWHGVKVFEPDWSANSHSLALSAELPREKLLLHLILNFYWEPLDFKLPAVRGVERNPWLRWIDTARASPDDIVEWRAAPRVEGCHYTAEARSVVALFARSEDRAGGEQPV
jgi:isoamylase